jgi:DNA-directed RNA polymerase specialized sigma24 family protein
VDDDSAALVARWRAGDERAAEVLVGRYTGRLLALARAHLSSRLVARFDPEDVVQSAYRSFFVGAKEDRFVLERSGDLWRLLAAITLNKLHRQVARQRAAKRSPDRERNFGGESSFLSLSPEAAARDPSSQEVVAVVEELELIMVRFKPPQRRMVELRLQGHTIKEIAQDVDRSERYVYAVLDDLKRRLRQRQGELGGD